jgi:beta-lactamase regulating signal transducer with metallopeptidase domain
MLPVVLEAAVRSTVVILVVLLALKALRVRNPHVLMAAWQMVLAASLLMPFLVGLVGWASFTVVTPGLIIPDIVTPELAGLVAVVAVPGPSSALSEMAPAATAVDWLAVGWWLYLLIAAWLMLRLIVGCVLTWRLCRSAVPVAEDWTAGRDVRAHPSVTVPSTFGSTILLPPSCVVWDAMQRRAVLAHEDAHVRRADFYVLALASINRAVFWFNPMAWWLHRRIADLAEVRSDVAAIQDIEDRVRYAEILLDLASSAGRSIVPAMARADTVRRRVERILTETIMPRTIDWRTRAVLVAAMLPLTALAAGAVVAQVPAPSQPQSIAQVDPIAMRRLEQARRRTEVFVDPRIFDNYVGHYQLDQLKAFTITRLGDRLFVQLTGQEFQPIYPESTHKFFYKGIKPPAQISFLTDPQGRATGLTLHQRGVERFAKRIEEAEAKALQEGFAKRRKEPTPMPGSEAALRRQILAFAQGQPAYHEMSEALASATRPQLARIQRGLSVLGALQSLSFRGVGLNGLDVYEAKFENGMAICRIYMAEDGKISGLLFQWGP